MKNYRYKVVYNTEKYVGSAKQKTEIRNSVKENSETFDHLQILNTEHFEVGYVKPHEFARLFKYLGESAIGSPIELVLET